MSTLVRWQPLIALSVSLGGGVGGALGVAPVSAHAGRNPSTSAPESPPPVGQEEETGQEQELTAEEQERRVLEALRRFGEGGEAEGERPGPEVAGPPALGEGEAAIHLYRAADMVEVIQNGNRRTLTFWNAHFIVDEGDEIRLGPKAKVLMDYPGGTRVTTTGPAILRLASAAGEVPLRLSVPLMEQKMLIDIGDDGAILDLPGGNQVKGGPCRLVIREIDLRALEFKNSGPESVEVRGPLLGDLLELEAGYKVYMPVPRTPLAFGQMTAVDSPPEVGRVGLEVGKGVELDFDSQWLRLSGQGPDPGVARVAGARVLLWPGGPLRLTRVPLGQGR